MKITKAIIPVAGWGTRRLPITKAVEKCMLPLLNRPIVDYIVRECIDVGVTDIYFVVNGDAQQLKRYYSHDTALEERLRASGKTDLLSQVQVPENVTFHYITQPEDIGYGTTVPVWLCRDYIEPGEQFIVIMGDQYLYRQDGGSDIADLCALVEQEQASGGLIGTPVPDDPAQYYGILVTDEQGRLVGINEQPKADDNKGTLKNTSFYVFDARIMDFADAQMRQQPNETGEYRLTDVVNDYVSAGNDMALLASQARYYDCGSLESWVQANTELLRLTKQ